MRNTFVLFCTLTTVLLGVCPALCQILANSDFDHEVHAVEGLNCADCHNSGSAEPSFAVRMPGRKICLDCHDSIRFPEIDDLTYDAWTLSRKAATQADVADELAEERAGQTPAEVVTGDDPENCVACHAPTAVKANGGMSETAALDYFFTTAGGRFTDATVGTNVSEWPDVECVACHDPHDPGGLSYFNSGTGEYEPMSSINALCGH